MKREIKHRALSISKKDLPKALLDFSESSDRSISNVGKLAIWIVFGDEEQQKIANKIIRENK